MEGQASESKTLFSVFDAAKRKRGRKKRDGLDDASSIASDDCGNQANPCETPNKISMHEITASQNEVKAEGPKRDRDSSPSDKAIHNHSPRRHRRRRENISLALKAGRASTPRSGTPPPPEANLTDVLNQDQDSLIYTFLEEALKRDKKKQRHSRRHEEKRLTRQREWDEEQSDHERHHRHRLRRHDEPSKDKDNETPKRKIPATAAETSEQSMLFETFAKMCAQMNEIQSHKNTDLVKKCSSHKSLQCESTVKKDSLGTDQHPVRLRNPDSSREYIGVTRVRSQEHLECRRKKREFERKPEAIDDRKDMRSRCPSYEKRSPSKFELTRSRMPNEVGDRCRNYQSYDAPARCSADYADRSDIYKESDRDSSRKTIDDDRRRCCGHKTSKSFDMRRDEYDDNERYRRTTKRIDSQRKFYNDHEDVEVKDKRDTNDMRCRHYERDVRVGRCDEHSVRDKFYDERGIRDKKYDERDVRDKKYDGRNVRDKKYDDRDVRDKKYNEHDDRDKRHDERRENYYDEKDRRDERDAHLPCRNRRSRRCLERFDKNSTASREEDYRERDKYSERERDSGLSIVDGENSTMSAKSNYLRVVKQEIAEQREAMDKMMKLWKELMRCFKGMSQAQGQKTAQDTASMQDSAASQLRLWRECMRRYETVARDVGDTDARLMEEINKQRSEMAEMGTLWQECLQRYKEMSTDFNNLKKQLESSESPNRTVVPPVAVCAEGEGTAPNLAYRLPPAHFPAPPTMAPMPPMPPNYMRAGSPLRARTSAPAPPPWWWCGEPQKPPARRRSSPESRSHSRERRHRHGKEREESRYKEDKKSTKPSNVRSEYRHRKR